MQILTTTVGRVMYAVPFGVFGAMHVLGAKNLAGVVPAYFPVSIFWVYLTGVAFLVACLAIITGKKAYLACVLLACMLGIFVLTVQLPGVFNEATRQFAMVNLLKDTSLSGAALVLAGVFKNVPRGAARP